MPGTPGPIPARPSPYSVSPAPKIATKIHSHPSGERNQLRPRTITGSENGLRVTAEVSSTNSGKAANLQEKPIDRVHAGRARRRDA